MKKIVQLTDVMFFNQSHRVTEEDIKKYNLQYLTVLGISKEGKTLCVYGQYDRETKKLLDYVNHGSQKDTEGIYEILSVKEFERNDESSKKFFFSMAKEEESKKVFGTWPELLTYKANNQDKEEIVSISGAHLENGTTMITAKCSLAEVKENGIIYNGTFYEIY